MSILYQDDFQRTESGGIGRPSDYDPASNPDASVDGNELRVVAGGSAWWDWLGAPDPSEGFYYYDFYVPADVNDFSTYYELDTKEDGGYATYIYAQAYDGAGDWAVGAYTPGVDCEVVFTPTPSTWYSVACHLDATEGMVRLKVWERGTVEPNWQDEQAHNGSVGAGWDPFLGVDGPDAEEARLDNIVVSDIPYSPDSLIFGLYAFIAGTFDITNTFDLNATLMKTYTSPTLVYPVWPSYVDSTSAAVGDATSITVAKPMGVVAGDLLVAILSMDMENVAAADWNSAPTGWSPLFGGANATGTVTSSGVQNLGDSRQRWYWKTAGASEPSDYTWGANRQTAIVGAIVAVRDAAPFASGDWMGVNTNNSAGTTHTFRTAGRAPQPRLVLHAATGNDPSPASWAPINPGVPNAQIEIEDIAATGPINQLVTYHIDDYFPTPENPFSSAGIDGHQATSSIATTTLAGTLVIRAISLPYVGLYAFLGSGGLFSVDAVIVAAYQQTRHARTGPHFGETPASAITLSGPMGPMLAGDSLQSALEVLDSLISERERGGP